MIDRPVVVAGNGASIAEIERGRVLQDDLIIRTNNFFFEPQYFLGRRVDLYFAAGDPRVARFMLETLHRCRADYDLSQWTSHNPKVMRVGQRRFAPLYQPLRYRDGGIEAEVTRLCAQFGKAPTTGVYAVLAAHGMGASEVILAGMDMYTGAVRYPFEPGRHHRDLMGLDLSQRGMDTRLHDGALDRAILHMLQTKGALEITRASENSALADMVDLAPLREGAALETTARHNPPTDWASRSGLYPITLLKTLRRGSALMRKRHV